MQPTYGLPKSPNMVRNGLKSCYTVLGYIHPGLPNTFRPLNPKPQTFAAFRALQSAHGCARKSASFRRLSHQNFSTQGYLKGSKG